MWRQSQGMFCVLKSDAKYIQECLKESRIFLHKIRLGNASQNCQKSGCVLLCFVYPYHLSLVVLSPPSRLYCVECVNRLRKKKLYLLTEWWHLKCRTFIRRGMRAEAKEDITCAFYLHLYSCACFWCWLYRLAMLTKSSKSWEMHICCSRCWCLHLYHMFY